MSTIVTVIFASLATVSFLFFYWRHLHEDYILQKIFQSGFYQVVAALLGAFVFHLISKNTHQTAIYRPQQLWFWGLVVGLIISFFIIKWKFKFRMNEVFEASTAGFLYAMFFVLSSQLFINFSLSFIISIAFIVLLIVIFHYLKANYKKFGWYHSGKVGFASFVTLGILFITRAVFAIFLRPNMISFVGRIDGLISVTLAFVIFLQLYNLSRKK